jgi:hypothetical protein
LPARKTKAADRAAQDPAVVANLDGFSPAAALENALRWWWIIVFLVVAGGAAGWLVHSMRPPLYEAVGHISAGIDYVSTGPMTQYSEDVALNAIGNIVISITVMEQVVEQVNLEGYPITLDELIKMSVVERRFTTWDLQVLNKDPKAAVFIASTWADVSRAALLESYQHAILADQYQRTTQALERCLVEASVAEEAPVICSPERFQELQEDLALAGEQIYAERVASQGLFSGLVIGPENATTSADAPVVYGRSQLVLAGGVIGLLLGSWLVQSRLPARVYTINRP